MNSRTKRKLRVLANAVKTNTLTKKGQEKVDSLVEVVNGKVVREEQLKYYTEKVLSSSK